MTRARVRVLVVIGIALAAALTVALALGRGGSQPLPQRPAGERPRLLLLARLPLVFGEDFSLQSTGSPALKALETRYDVVPISVAAPAELAKGRILLMAQPLAQPPEDLVALDRWVRDGGRLLLLADPLLEWPSERPLGDPLRPPATFMDTGLLGHWGLRLDAPDERGPRMSALGNYDVLTVSPGTLSGRCDIGANRVVAHCRLGKGRATVVADADLLQGAQLGRAGRHNLDGLIAELAELEEK